VGHISGSVVAAAEDRIIVTEKASDFAATTSYPVLLVLKLWEPCASLTKSPASARDRWGKTAPPPDNWAHWLPAELR